MPVWVGVHEALWVPLPRRRQALYQQGGRRTSLMETQGRECSTMPVMEQGSSIVRTGISPAYRFGQIISLFFFFHCSERTHRFGTRWKRERKDPNLFYQMVLDWISLIWEIQSQDLWALTGFEHLVRSVAKPVEVIPGLKVECPEVTPTKPVLLDCQGQWNYWQIFEVI